MHGRTEVLQMLVILGEQTKEQLSQERLAYMVAELLPHGAEKVAHALRGMLRTARRFPTVAEVEESLGISEASDESRAAEAASRIEGAMVKFGSMGAMDKFKRQREWMGVLAWAVVDRCGGWQHLCDSTENDDLPTLKAQWRNLALALCGSAKRGTLDQGPSLPEGQTHPAIEALARSLPDPNKDRPPF